MCNFACLFQTCVLFTPHIFILNTWPFLVPIAFYMCIGLREPNSEVLFCDDDDDDNGHDNDIDACMHIHIECICCLFGVGMYIIYVCLVLLLNTNASNYFVFRFVVFLLVEPFVVQYILFDRPIVYVYVCIFVFIFLTVFFFFSFASVIFFFVSVLLLSYATFTHIILVTVETLHKNQ